MEGTVQKLFDCGIAPSTSRVYRSAKNRYLSFCAQYQLSAIPLNENTLCLYIAFLHLQGVKHQSVKSYLSALRHLQIEEGGGDPFAPGKFSRLEYVLKGLKRSGPAVATCRRLPITPRIMLQLHSVWSQSTDRYVATMLWAACCLGFFGFLRSGEFTVDNERDFDANQSLTPGDVAVDNHDNPSVVSVFIKQSKNDPFREGVRIFLGRTGSVLCPVAAILGYLAVREGSSGPLFVFRDGKPLTRAKLVQYLRTALDRCGINSTQYSGHSFRIGAASAAAQAGIEDSVIQMLGRWHSSAYVRYIRTPREQLAALSARMASQTYRKEAGPGEPSTRHV